jgi:chaperonin GroES
MSTTPQPITAYRPIGDRLFVSLIEPTKKVGSIFLPEKSPDDPTGRGASCEGIVVAVGPGAYTKKLVFVTPSVKVGDRVLFSRFAGQDAVIEGRTVRVLAECDVLLVKGSQTLEEFNELAA